MRDNLHELVTRGDRMRDNRPQEFIIWLLVCLTVAFTAATCNGYSCTGSGCSPRPGVER